VTRPIRRLLVANRGEIAVRVLRAGQERGIVGIAVASDPDLHAYHARVADVVMPLGGSAPNESYLVMDRILAAAKESRADAIHPGYGFLAENAEFARRVASEGITFVGPSPEVIEEMGLKTRARARMIAAGVPVVPGREIADDAGDAEWKRAADEVGFPLLVKAAAGGGGKGMRAVHDPQDLLDAVAAARREAESAFGDGRVYLERLLIRPRHVEVQILGDTHGHVVHLGERDCSVQRRHQKVVEESPAPGLSDDLRAAMHAPAVRAAEEVAYVGAGTVEMLLDASGEFFFLEMNTRLQVEHPVTELVTGIDLVGEQIAIAEGKPISFTQDQVAVRGHALEARLYAEDPARGFLPQTGEVLCFDPPDGPGLRSDTGLVTGGTVTSFYDPMLAKLCAHGTDREQARHRLLAALRRTALLGVGSNLEYLAAILEVDAFASGDVHTGLIEEHLADWKPDPHPPVEALAVAGALLDRPAAVSGAGGGEGETLAPLWATLGPRRFGGSG